MLAAGFISDAPYRRRSPARSSCGRARRYTKIREPFFFSYVRDQLIAEYGAAYVDRWPAASTRRSTSASRSWPPRPFATPSTSRPDPASAIVAINPANGAIRAMVSVTPSGQRSQFNLAAQGKRQAGSAFKTFALTEATGAGWTPIRPRTSPRRSSTNPTRRSRPGAEDLRRELLRPLDGHRGDASLDTRSTHA